MLQGSLLSEPKLFLGFTVPSKYVAPSKKKKNSLARQILLLHTILGCGFLIDAQTWDHTEKRKRSYGSGREKEKKKIRAPSPPCCFSPVCSSHFSKESVSIYYCYQPECRQTFTTCCSGSRCLPSFHTKASSFDGSTCCKGHHLFSLSLSLFRTLFTRALYFSCVKKAFPFSPVSIVCGWLSRRSGPWPPAPPCTPTLYIVASTEGPAGGAAEGRALSLPPFILFLLMFFYFCPYHAEQWYT